MKEKISLIQMDVELGQVERNYEKAVQLMELALEDKPAELRQHLDHCSICRFRRI